jgi:hypothetical protein
MGTPWEVDWNIFGTKKSKKFKTPQPLPPSPQIKRTLGLLGACCITSLAQQNFYFFICLSPFSAYNNGMEYGPTSAFCFFFVFLGPIL